MGRAVMEASHVMAQIIRTGSPCIKEIICPASYTMTMTPAHKNQDAKCVHITRPRVDELNSLALKPLEWFEDHCLEVWRIADVWFGKG